MNDILLRVGLPLIIGSIGGVLFHLLGLPAAWLSGGVIFMTTATLMGMPLAFPAPLKRFLFVFLGLILGSAVSPQTINRMGQWPLSLILLSLTMVGATYIVMEYLKKQKFDQGTAFFASIPGALSFVLALASDQKGLDQRFIALFQSVRLLALVVLLPLLLTILGIKGNEVIKPIISLREGIILVVVGGLAGLLFEKLKVPAGALLGSMIATAILYGLGIISGELPRELQAFCFLLMALLVSERFWGTSFRELGKILKPSLIGFFISLIITAIGSLIASFWLKIPLTHVLLAFAPGGIEAMMILAFIFDADPAYVGAHHLIRFLGIALVLPFVIKLFRFQSGDQDLEE